MNKEHHPLRGSVFLRLIEIITVTEISFYIYFYVLFECFFFQNDLEAVNSDGVMLADTDVCVLIKSRPSLWGLFLNSATRISPLTATSEIYVPRGLLYERE